jgi:hypothetical protein
LFLVLFIIPSLSREGASFKERGGWDFVCTLLLHQSFLSRVKMK